MFRMFRSKIMTYFEKIKNKVKKEINPESVVLIDNSHLHTKHKSFDVNKFHLRIIIKSKKLKSMNKIEAHKEIFSILKEEMKEKIHALEIEIQQFLYITRI